MITERTIFKFLNGVLVIAFFGLLISGLTIIFLIIIE